MTEEISPLYDNVDIKVWARQIHGNKIREFADAIDLKKKEAYDYIELDISQYSILKAIDEISRGLVIACDLIRMELKLEDLKKAYDKKKLL